MLVFYHILFGMQGSKFHMLILLSGLMGLTGCKDLGKMFSQSGEEQEKRSALKGYPSDEDFTDSLDGKPIRIYELRNSIGTRVLLSNYGARVIGVWLLDAKGAMTDVCLGMGSSADYLNPGAKFFGSVIGRFANRIAKGGFTLDGVYYTLDQNNGPNSLHGGRTGFHSRVWESAQVGSDKIIFSLVSPDGEEGYPGNLLVSVTYQMMVDNSLHIEYAATCDARTVLNLTNHAFWNLNGEGSGDILGHEMMIASTRFTPIDSNLIPTGIEPVAGTPLDFSTPAPIGQRIGQDHPQLLHGKGYDHNFILNGRSDSLPRLAARVRGNKSGIVMEVLTDQPGIQFYSGNFMKGAQTLKSGAKDDFRTAFCLETQHFPDSPNRPEFPSTVLEAGERFHSTTLYRFRIEKAP